jgi:hypothetical protein
MNQALNAFVSIIIDNILLFLHIILGTTKDL